MENPYYILPAVEALPTAAGEERKALIRLIAANIGDEATLRAIIGVDPAEFADFYPDMKPPQLSTDETISTFMNRFASGATEDNVSEAAAEIPVGAPAVDYATLLASEGADSEGGEKEGEREGEETPSDATSDAISAFLAAVPPKTPKASGRHAPKAAPKERPREHDEADPELSEALFRMMVKNKNYTKALEIIKELSLNNPKKSVYFAYQIRFLEKLIKNQSNLQGEKPEGAD